MNPDPELLAAFEAELNSHFQTGRPQPEILALIGQGFYRRLICAGAHFALTQAVRDGLVAAGEREIEFALEGFGDLPRLPLPALSDPPAHDCVAAIAGDGPNVLCRHDANIARPAGCVVPGFEDVFDLRQPRQRIACLRGAAVIRSSLVMTTRRTLMREPIDYDTPAKRYRYNPTRRSNVKMSGKKLYYNVEGLPKSVRILSSPAIFLSGERRFFATWMVQLFSRLYVLDHIRRDDLHVVVPGDLWANCVDMLLSLGFPPERIVMAAADEMLVCETLYMPTSPAFEWEYFRPEAMRPYGMLRERLLPGGDAGPPRNVYISRGDGRGKKPTNDAAIAALLQSKGFEVILLGSMNTAEKVKALGSARVVVCSLGSGAFNTLLCEPGKVSLVFLGGEFHNNGAVATLPALLDAPVSYVFGTVDPEAAEAANPGAPNMLGMGDFEIDLDALSRVVDDALAASAAREAEAGARA